MPTDLPLTALTTATVEGGGVFDKLMQANKAHLEQEFAKLRIRGPEYSTVYLGSLQAVLQAALQFMLQAPKVAAEIDLIKQQTLNAEVEGRVLEAQECKLKAEFDLLQQQILKTTAETNLLTQKIATERAQTMALGVEEDSVIGKQKKLYQAQSDGFARDAEQKAAGILVDTWKVRRTTDDGTIADATNRLNDATIGSAISKLLSGVQIP